MCHAMLWKCQSLDLHVNNQIQGFKKKTMLHIDINATNGLGVKNAIQHLQFPKQGENHERIVRSWNQQPNYYHKERVSKQKLNKENEKNIFENAFP